MNIDKMTEMAERQKQDDALYARMEDVARFTGKPQLTAAMFDAFLADCAPPVPPTNSEEILFRTWRGLCDVAYVRYNQELEAANISDSSREIWKGILQQITDEIAHASSCAPRQIPPID